MEVTVYKCEECGSLYEKKEDYDAHLARDAAKKAWDKKYPDIKDDRCIFANGGYSIQRTEEWFKQMEKDLLETIAPLKISYEPFSYGWFRVLDDGGHWQYAATYKWQSFCLTCFREWGQPYYANKCTHQDGGKK